MRIKPQCVTCLLQWVFVRGAVAGNQALLFDALRHLFPIARTQTHERINTASASNKLVAGLRDVMGDVSRTYYQTLKKKNNENAARLLDDARDFIDAGSTAKGKLERACQVATAGNVAPLGTPSEGFRFDEVKEVIHGKLKPVISGDVYGAIKNATRVLYVTDNAGEIGFDSLLISKLKELGCHVTLVVKEPIFFEDATPEDAAFFDLNQQVAAVVTVNGVFVPGEAPPEIADILKNIDVIIAKGTGNFEALRGEVMDKPVIYMLKVKCAPIAVNTGIAAGNFAVIVDAGANSPN